MGHKRRGGRAAGARKKKGGLLIGMRGGLKRAVGAAPARAKSSGPGAFGRLWTLLTIALVVVAAVMLFRRFGGR